MGYTFGMEGKPEDMSSKIEEIRNLLKIEYTEEEKREFEEWKENLPQNSLESPISVSGAIEIVGLLPSSPNWQKEHAEIFFHKEVGFLEDELIEIFKAFSVTNPKFEISLTKLIGGIISITIGNKESGGANKSGECYGHYHPTLIIEKIPNKDKLPGLFLEGMMPSRGDLLVWEESFKKGQKINRIFSKLGYIEVEVQKDFKGFFPESIAEFTPAYFDLFLGENHLGFKTEGEAINYFKDKFSWDVRVHRFAVDEE